MRVSNLIPILVSALCIDSNAFITHDMEDMPFIGLHLSPKEVFATEAYANIIEQNKGLCVYEWNECTYLCLSKSSHLVSFRWVADSTPTYEDNTPQCGYALGA